MLSHRTTALGPQHGSLDHTQLPRPQQTVTRLSKRIHRYVSEEVIEVQLTTDLEGRVARVECRGSVWQAVLLGCGLLARTKPLERADVLEVLQGFSALEDSVEIYERAPSFVGARL